MSEPQPDTILAALERVLAWPEIARSPQLQRFLDYIVRRTIDGNGQAIKAYTIAVDVFGRPQDFDPQSDPIVRVQARRLRSLLEQYYAGPGREETVRIVMPVGRYVPDFVAAVPLTAIASAPLAPAVESGKPVFKLSWFALGVLATGLVLTALSLSIWAPRQQHASDPVGAVQWPSLTVLEFQNLAGSGALAPVASGLAIELVTDLALFEDIDVRYGGTMSALPDAGAPTDYVLTGIVRPDGTNVQYSAILTDQRLDSVVWNHTISVTSAEARSSDVLDLVSRALSLVLGSTRGPLHSAAREFIAMEGSLTEGANLYLCRVAFDIYRQAGGAAEAERVKTCLDGLPEGQRAAARALAMSASLVAEFASPAVATESSDAARLLRANQAIEDAIALAPTSAFVWEQQGFVALAATQAEAARRAFGSSLQLNPASTDALAAYALLLAFDGQLNDAAQPARDAVEGAPNPPPWYFGVPTLLALKDGAFRQAVQNAELYVQADREVGTVLAILAGQAAGDSAVVSRFLPQLLELQSFRSRGVLTRLRERISDDALMEQIRASLVTAGVPPSSLISSF